MVIIKALLDLIDTEPALVTGLVSAVLILLVALGVHLPPNVQDAIKGVVAAVIVLIAAVYVRSKSVPVTKVPPVAPPGVGG